MWERMPFNNRAVIETKTCVTLLAGICLWILVASGAEPSQHDSPDEERGPAISTDAPRINRPNYANVRASVRGTRSTQRERYEALQSGEASDWSLEGGSASDEAQNSWFRSVKNRRPSVALTTSGAACVSSPLVDAFGDASDTFGAGPPVLDIDSVTVSTDGINLSFSITFHTPISAPSSGAPNAVGGALEFDTDQNTLTGRPPLQDLFSPPFTALGLGVDFVVELFSEIDTPGFVVVVDANFIVVGSIPITYGAQSLSGVIPLGMLGGDDGVVDFTTIIGTFSQPTDALEVCGSSGDGEPPPLECFDNASFESGDFASWVTQDLAVPFFELQVAGAGLSPGFEFFVSSPTDGASAALHGWDGEGPGTIVIAQDISVPADATTVSFDYRGAWDLTFGATLDRTFHVVIRSVGGGASLQAPDLILTAGAGTTVTDTGDLLGQVDVSAFAGQAIRISFEWFVPEFFTGPAFFQVDNVRCKGGAPPQECDRMDADGDGDIDLRDFARFQKCFSGSQ